MQSREKIFQTEETSMHKGPEAAKGLACLRNREEARIAGALRRVRKKQLDLTGSKEPP